MKTVYLSSKGTKLNQVILLISVIFIFTIFVLLFILTYKDFTNAQIIQFGIIFITWISLIYYLTKLSDAKMIGNKIIYKKILSEEKQFTLNEIVKIKIKYKDFVCIKYSKRGKQDTLWIRNKEKLTKAFDIYKIIVDAKREFEK